MLGAGQFVDEAGPALRNYAAEKSYAEQSVDQGGLVRIVNLISENTAKVDQIASLLQQLSVGIHGPRPEAVGEASNRVGATQDSLQARVSNLSEAVSRLNRAYESIVR